MYMQADSPMTSTPPLSFFLSAASRTSTAAPPTLPSSPVLLSVVV